jgi:hypothetical protein
MSTRLLSADREFAVSLGARETLFEEDETDLFVELMTQDAVFTLLHENAKEEKREQKARALSTRPTCASRGGRPAAAPCARQTFRNARTARLSTPRGRQHQRFQLARRQIGHPHAIDLSRDDHEERDDTDTKFSTLPVFAWPQSRKSEMCSFCLELFKPCEQIMTLPCFHVFHEKELREWLAINPSCPTCKTCAL